MKTLAKTALGLVLFLALPRNAALGHSFGDLPLEDVYYAAENANLCPDLLSTEELAAYMLAPTWWEVTGANSDLTPSPMTLGRADGQATLYPPGQDGNSSPYRRAFWHPGIGTWQLDDIGIGTNLSIGKFGSRDAAVRVALTMSERYCNSPTVYSIFGPWCACGSDGTCGSPDRDRCKATFDKIYDPDGTPTHPVESDLGTDRFGGSEVRTCRFAEQTDTFLCIYVKPGNAEGYTGSPDGDPYGWTSFPEASPPLSRPFYVFKERDGDDSYEWRYWMNADTDFGFDYAARRLYGANSRTPGNLSWYDNIGGTSIGLCDVSNSRGNCRFFCSAETSQYGLAEKGTCPSDTPEIFTKEATNLTQDSATLNLSVNPSGSPTQVWFVWGTSSGQLDLSTSLLEAGNGTTLEDKSWTLTSLLCETTYYYQAWADGLGDPIAGDIFPFTTESCSDDGGGSTPQELIQNGDFALDDAYWFRENNFFADDRYDEYGNYHSAPGYAYLSLSNGSGGNYISGRLYQEVTIPSTATSANLGLWRYISTTEPSGNPPSDVMQLTIRDATGEYLEGLYSYSNWSATSGYVYDTFNLDSYIGETIRLQFFGTTNGSYPTVFRIDDVSLIVEVPEASSPDVETLHPDQLTSSSARLNLRVNPKSDETHVWFDLEANDSSPNTDTARFSAGSGSDEAILHYTVSDLDCDTRYYVRANAENSLGSDSGLVESFLTDECPVPPGADSDPPESVTSSSAVFTGDVDPNGIPTDGWFEWGGTQALGLLTQRQYVGGEDGDVKIRHEATGLQCDTRYYFKVFAENALGLTDEGSFSSFKTDSCNSYPPLVQTSPAADITALSAILAGQVDSNGLSTEAWFQWGETTSLGSATVHQLIGSNGGFVSVTEPLDDLACETTYYYQAAASNSDGTTFGTTESFTTGACSTCGENDLVLSDLTVSSTEAYEACNSISVGPAVTVEGTGSLELSAPSVSFGDGFSVQNGGSLKVFGLRSKVVYRR